MWGYGNDEEERGFPITIWVHGNREIASDDG
jgi:hypothetical protein